MFPGLRPFLLQALPCVPVAEVSASHHLAVELVANTPHLPFVVNIRNNIDALPLQSFDQLGGRRPAPDCLVNVRLKTHSRAQDASALKVLHLLLGRAPPHRLAARFDLPETELLFNLSHELFGAFVIFRIGDRFAVQVDE